MTWGATRASRATSPGRRKPVPSWSTSAKTSGGSSTTSRLRPGASAASIIIPGQISREADEQDPGDEADPGPGHGDEQVAEVEPQEGQDRGPSASPPDRGPVSPGVSIAP